jgi:ABC-2 type transport system permease protein
VVLPLIVIATWLSPAISYPVGPELFAAAAGSMLLGLVLNMMMQSAFAMIAFWTTQSSNVFGLVSGIGQFLSGYIAPLALFPEQFRQVANLLPFRSLVSLPVEMLMGKLSWAEIGFGYAVTLIWLAIFTLIYRLAWRAGLRQYEAVGA